MYYLDYAKPVAGGGYILNFFADTVEDLKDVPTTTPYITRNGTNYGIPLDTSVVTIIEKGEKVNYVLQQGRYIAGGDIAPVVAAKSITENGTYLAKDEKLDGFSSVTVDVNPALQEKSQVPNTNPVAVEPDEGYYGLSKVTVEAIPSDYIIPNGTKTITANGETDVKTFAKVDVNVEPRLQVKTQTPGASSATVKPDAGYYGLSQVTVNAVPVETKSTTPTKAAQTITPSEGKFLSSVAVEAIPSDYIIPTGNKDITANNNGIDVKAVATVNVNVVPKLQSKTTNENGTIVPDKGYDGLSQVSVNVQSYNGDNKAIKYMVDGSLEPIGVAVPEGETYISSSKYQGMGSIKYLSLPHTLEERGVGVDAFKGCLPEIISVPPQVEDSSNVPWDNVKIGFIDGSNQSVNMDIRYWPNAENLEYLFVKNVRNISGRINNYGQHNVRIISLDNVNRIGYAAFESGVNAEALACVILNNVNRIDKSAFAGNNNLSAVEFSGTTEFIGDKSFSACTALPNVILPDTVKHIGYQAFNRTNIIDGNNNREVFLKSLGNDSNFALIDNSRNSSNTTVVLPSAKIYAGGTFRDFNNLVDITIPDGVISIGNGCFYNCSKLKTVTIPSSVKWIGSATSDSGGSFSLCPALTTVYINGDLSKSEKPKGIFTDCPALTEIHYDGQVFTTANEFLEYGWPSGSSSSGS